MEQVLTISTTWGSDDPTKATIPFHLARSAKQAGIQVRVVLAGDLTELIRAGKAETVRGKRVPPLRAKVVPIQTARRLCLPETTQGQRDATAWHARRLARSGVTRIGRTFAALQLLSSWLDHEAITIDLVAGGLLVIAGLYIGV